MGSEFVSAFAESYVMIPGISSVNLTSNRINDPTCAKIISGTAQLANLDLSCNKMALKGATELGRILSLSDTMLININLERNQLNSSSISIICQGLAASKTI